MIYKEIVDVFNDCQIILFLRKVSKITFFNGTDCVFIIQKIIKDNTVQLFNDRTLESEWILKEMTIGIDDNLSKKLATLSDTECPQKLKETKHTKLTFAARVQNDKLLAVPRSVIYSYLPTKSQKGFSFLINGDFLTNAERTELMQNIWNEFLFKEIAVKQLEWFTELQNTMFKYDVLKLLKGKYPSYSSSVIELGFNDSLDIAAKTISFLPVEQTEDLTTIVNSIRDTYNLSKCFNSSTILDYLNLPSTMSIIDLQMNDQSVLSELGSKDLTFLEVIFMVNSDKANNINSAIRFMVFFYNNTIKNNNPDWLPNLKTVSFIMDQHNIYKSPQEVFYPIAQYSDSLSFSQLSYIHPQILLHFKTAELHYKQWLSNLGVKEPDNVEVFRKAIVPLINQNKIDKNNILEITDFVFTTHKSKNFSEHDYENLRKLPVLTNNGLYKSSQTYFSDDYNPDKKLSKILVNANFLATDYVKSEDDKGEWKVFFKRIGVRDNISIDIIEEKIERVFFESQNEEAKSYFTWLESKEEYPGLYHSYRYSGQHHISHFTKIEFRSHLADLDFSKFFWSSMLDSWDTLKNKCSNTKYFYRGGSSPVSSFLNYYIVSFPSVPATDGICYRSVELFSPNFKAIVGDSFPVVDFPVATTKEQIDFFGFKTYLSVSECLAILDNLAAKSISGDTTKQIFAVYNYVIGHGITDKNAVLEWRKNAKVLAINNTIQPVEKLYITNINSDVTPVNSDRFLKLPLGRISDEIVALSEFLMIPLISESMLEFVSHGESEDQALKAAIESKLTYLAIIHSHNTSDEFVKVVERLRQILNAKNFFRADKLRLVYSNEEKEMIIDINIDVWNTRSKQFYYTGDWKKPVTLYSLSSGLCEMLELKNMEREFELIFQLDDQDILDWLVKNKFNTEQIEELGLFVDIHHDITEEGSIDENDIAEKFSEFSIDFVAQLQVEEIAHSISSPVVKELVDFSAINVRQYTQVENDQTRIEIGRWAEEYANKYFKENSEIFTSVKWMNENEESFLPYDFEITELGIEKLIEVKGTPSNDNLPVLLSQEEWKVLFATGKDYSIFRVLGAGTENHRMERTDDLKTIISEGRLIDFPIKLYLE
ncbi:DUF3883 domain-containing protein [Chryseobacterium jejuense]|uniref:Protein NO VEIN C-terminal domain-containing protein n=1 Tax=Chryseobacterium jejuense TaxID=445960 RepID=A0A2X2Z9Y9_CHRJE|nr:DUF3883 domain-containing protein [Chryseobacterium jejuense]SQB46469.1 Uncharacterised protein [Chryseobacterium jejuense]